MQQTNDSYDDPAAETKKRELGLKQSCTTCETQKPVSSAKHCSTCHEPFKRSHSKRSCNHNVVAKWADLRKKVPNGGQSEGAEDFAAPTALYVVQPEPTTPSTNMIDSELDFATSVSQSTTQAQQTNTSDRIDISPHPALFFGKALGEAWPPAKDCEVRSLNGFSSHSGALLL